MDEELFEFTASDIRNVMIVKFTDGVRIVIGTVCLIEVYGGDDFNTTLEIMEAKDIGAER